MTPKEKFINGDFFKVKSQEPTQTVFFYDSASMWVKMVGYDKPVDAVEVEQFGFDDEGFFFKTTVLGKEVSSVIVFTDFNLL